ncbi:MAG TPA: thioredoxin-dependent thiol peroxidase [Patescibacteria group bacterium]|nr:thioredoxin-dependent thiol peroxidase [Patescibacteria group bacterium]
MFAPDFNLPDQDGRYHSLSEYRGRFLVLYFYPKDDTPGCTKEACSFRDASEEFKKAGAEIVGVSKDTVRSHKKFEQKFHLNFTLLSDPEHEMIESYGAWGRKKFMGREFDGIFRNTYLINPIGEIVRAYERVNPLTHSAEIIRYLRELAEG